MLPLHFIEGSLYIFFNWHKNVVLRVFNFKMLNVSFQVKSPSCVKQKVAGAPLLSTPVCGNTCLCIQVKQHILASLCDTLDYATRDAFPLFCNAIVTHIVFVRNADQCFCLSSVFYEKCAVLCFRREAASVHRLWENLFSEWQQKRSHEEASQRCCSCQ